MHEPRNYEYFFIDSSSPTWHSRFVIIDDSSFNEANDVAYAFFSRPEPKVYKQETAKEKDYSYFSAKKEAPQDDLFADLAKIIGDLFSKILFGNIFEQAFTSKADFASQKPSFDKAKDSTAKEMPKAAPKAHFQSAASMPSAQRAPASKATPFASAPREVRENDKYKNNEALQQIAALYNRQSGKREEDATKDSAQATLKAIFKVDSYAEAKKQYKKLCVLIHPDKTKSLGAEAQKYLEKLYTFISDYYSLAG
jgi:hypothetical protein